MQAGVQAHPQPRKPDEGESVECLTSAGQPSAFRPFPSNHNFPFQGKSTTKQDFPAWESCRQGLIKQGPQIPSPSGKFDGLSTFRSHYVPHELIATESCKPADAPLKRPLPFDDITTYSLEYMPKKLETCPASYPSPPGYLFETTNSQGHKFFRKIAPAVKAF